MPDPVSGTEQARSGIRYFNRFSITSFTGMTAQGFSVRAMLNLSRLQLHPNQRGFDGFS